MKRKLTNYLSEAFCSVSKEKYKQSNISFTEKGKFVSKCLNLSNVKINDYNKCDRSYTISHFENLNYLYEAPSTAHSSTLIYNKDNDIADTKYINEDNNDIKSDSVKLSKTNTLDEEVYDIDSIDCIDLQKDNAKSNNIMRHDQEKSIVTNQNSAFKPYKPFSTKLKEYFSEKKTLNKSSLNIFNNNIESQNKTSKVTTNSNKLVNLNVSDKTFNINNISLFIIYS